MIDERFLLHRFKATSHAALVAAALAAFFFLRDYYRGAGVRVDLLIILLAMVVTKLAAMIYYRRTD